jgi:hypothetical protein
MRIQSSDVQLASARLAFEQTSVKESMTAWVGDRPGTRSGPPRDVAQISGPPPHRRSPAEECTPEETDELDPEQSIEPRLRAFLYMLEKLTGYKIKMRDVEDLELDDEEIQQKAAAAMEQIRPTRAGWGVEYEYHEVHDELEHVEFSAEGVVRTADGKEIAFQVGMQMTREEHTETHISVRAGDAVVKDPLVLNFGGTAAQLTDTKFAFDLDTDGTSDQISFVGSGSGFLVFDKNSDGVANDGSELFGPATGNGFADLAAYDDDGNGWIDEADAVFDDLAVWTKDGAGNDKLTGLLAAGVGAIYLRSASTGFDLGEGQLVSTGVFLGEQGGAGTVQQIDLYV